METVTDIITIGVMIAPIGVQLFKFIGAKTHNERMVMLSNRASMIVDSLENSPLESSDKKLSALKSLSDYCDEVGVKITAQQANEYIEQAVKLVNDINQSTK